MLLGDAGRPPTLVSVGKQIHGVRPSYPAAN